MLLCLDVGNSNIFGGVFIGDSLKLRFRHDTSHRSTSDQMGVFLRTLLREHDIDPTKITEVAISSVVPALDYSVRAACLKYFNVEPFMLKTGVRTGLKINYHNSLDLGSDRIANAIAAVAQFPNQNIIVVGFGTATTFCAVAADKTFLGGAISPGIRLCMDALQLNAAKLPPVEIVRAIQAVGRSTVTNMQAGLYFGHLGMVREIISRITEEVFQGKTPVTIGTGGFVHLFEPEKLFTMVLPDLILQGLYLAINLNKKP